MSTKDCIAALNAALDDHLVPYEGNRKFKRVSKKKDEAGRVVRTFVDNTHAFKVIGDGPYDIAYDMDADVYNPSRAAKPTSAGGMGDGWYFSLGGPESTMVEQDFEEGVLCGFYLVRKSHYDKEGYIESIHVSEEFPELPSQFEEVMEACFLSQWDVDTTRAWLLVNGFETNAELEAMANDDAEE